MVSPRSNSFIHVMRLRSTRGPVGELPPALRVRSKAAAAAGRDHLQQRLKVLEEEAARGSTAVEELEARVEGLRDVKKGPFDIE